MRIRLRSKIFDISFKFNKTAVLAELGVIGFLIVMFTCSQSAATTLLLVILFIANAVMVLFILFNDFEVIQDKIDSSENAEKKKGVEKAVENVSTLNKKKCSPKAPPPIRKLDTEVPDYSKESEIKNDSADEVTSTVGGEVKVATNWKDLLMQ